MDTASTHVASDADTQAARAVERHHEHLAGELARKVDAVAATALGEASGFERARDDLVAWTRSELLPHARAEEETMYRAAATRPEARLLVEAMVADHVTIGHLVDALAGTTDPRTAVVTAGGLRTAFEMHLAKENDQILPVLLAAPDVSVAQLLGGMHELLGEAAGGHGHRPAGGHADAH